MTPDRLQQLREEEERVKREIEIEETKLKGVRMEGIMEFLREHARFDYCVHNRAAESKVRFPSDSMREEFMRRFGPSAKEGYHCHRAIEAGDLYVRDGEISFSFHLRNRNFNGEPLSLMVAHGFKVRFARALQSANFELDRAQRSYDSVLQRQSEYRDMVSKGVDLATLTPEAIERDARGG